MTIFLLVPRKDEPTCEQGDEPTYERGLEGKVPPPTCIGLVKV